MEKRRKVKIRVAKRKNKFSLKALKQEIKIAKEIQKRVGKVGKDIFEKSDEQVRKIVEDVKKEFDINIDKIKTASENLRTLPKNLLDKKYEFELEALNLEKEKKAKKKFIVIQVDAVSYKTLKLAIKKGYCKFIKKLLDNKRYNLTNYNCGLPSITPFTQTGIMFGDNSMIPNFRFIDKKKKRDYSHANSKHVHMIEKKYFSRNQGIMPRGSSFMNLYSGGAKYKTLTMSAIDRKEYVARIKDANVFALIFLNPWSVIKFFSHFFLEYFTDLIETLYYNAEALFTKNIANLSFFFFPIRRTVVNVAFRELSTKGVILDLKRGVPQIYVNFNSYDEIAHHRGPKTRSALVVLKDIDDAIKRIYKNMPEDYDLYILSDHGQEESIRFQKEYKQTLQQIVKKVSNAKTVEYEDDYEEMYTFKVNVIKKIKQLARFVSSPLRLGSKILVKMLSWGVGKVPLRLRWGKNKIFLQTTDCYSGVYFTFTNKQANLSEIDDKYKLLLPTLINHPGIEFIIGNEDDTTVVLGKEGRAVIEKGFTIFGKSILKKFGDPKKIAEQIRYMMKLKKQADLVILGAFKDGKATSFTNHIGVHGGLGGEMCNSFFISKKRFNLSNVINAKELYGIFKSYSAGN